MYTCRILLRQSLPFSVLCTVTEALGVQYSLVCPSPFLSLACSSIGSMLQILTMDINKRDASCWQFQLLKPFPGTLQPSLVLPSDPRALFSRKQNQEVEKLTNLALGVRLYGEWRKTCCINPLAFEFAFKATRSNLKEGTGLLLLQ